jgi:hypothetical protein
MRSRARSLRRAAPRASWLCASASAAPKW